MDQEQDNNPEITHDRWFRATRFNQNRTYIPPAYLILKDERGMMTLADDGQAAMLELVEELAWVIRTCARRAGEECADEDAMQDARLALIKTVQDYDPHYGTRLSTLFYYRALKAFQNARNANFRHKATLCWSDLADDDEDDAPIDERWFAAPDEDVIESADLSDALSQLSHIDRDVIADYFGLTEVGEMTLAQIGQKHNRSAEWVRLTKERSLRVLRQIYQGQEM